MILGGINQLMNLIAARRLGPVPFGFWVAPSLILITGLFVILKPMETAELPLLILGWCSLLYGVTELINALKIYSIRKRADRQAEELARQRETEENAVVEEISSEINNDADTPNPETPNSESTTSAPTYNGKTTDEYDNYSAD